MENIIIKALCEKIERLELRIEQCESLLETKIKELQNEREEKFKLFSEFSKLKTELEKIQKERKEISNVFAEVRKEEEKRRGRPKKEVA